MMGITRVGHHCITLLRSHRCSRSNNYHNYDNSAVIVMPISFGHHAATDQNMSFTARLVSLKPVMIRDLPVVSRIYRIFNRFCLFDSVPQQYHQHRSSRDGRY